MRGVLDRDDISTRLSECGRHAQSQTTAAPRYQGNFSVESKLIENHGSPPSRLIGENAAIGVESLPGHVTRVWADQEGNDGGDISAIAHVAHWNTGVAFSVYLGRWLPGKAGDFLVDQIL